MNILSAFRLLIDFTLIICFCLASSQCTKTKDPRKVDKGKGNVANKSREKIVKKKEKKMNSGKTSKQSNENVVETPKDESAITPAVKAAAKSSSKASKVESTEALVTPSQKLDVNQLNQASSTVQVCPTQEDEVSVKPISNSKPKIKEEYFEDQNDDDTLGCVKSIEN